MDRWYKNVTTSQLLFLIARITNTDWLLPSFVSVYRVLLSPCNRRLREVLEQKRLMITLRCTRKLLDRAGHSIKAETAPPTTILGDWCANLVHARPQQLALCINERTLLVVVLPARDFKNVAPRFRAQAASLLTRIGVPAAAVAAEEKAMSDFAFGPTANRRVLGCLNEAAFALSYELVNPRFGALAGIEDYFCEYVYRTTKYRRPGDLAKELFAASGLTTGASVSRIH